MIALNDRGLRERVLSRWGWAVLLTFFSFLSYFLYPQNCYALKAQFPKEFYSKGALLRAVLDFDEENIVLLRVLLGNFSSAYLDGYYLEFFSPDRRKVCDGPASARVEGEKTVFTCKKYGKVIELTLNEGDELIGIATGPVRVTAGTRQWLTPGAVVLKNGDRDLRLINYLYIEEYLKGVVPYEMPPSWPLEALKAQAVAARTYTIRTLLWRRKRGEDYDLRSTVADQVYNGISGWKERTNEAVDQTRGLVLAYEGKPIFAFYSADCGGHTQDGNLVFRDRLGKKYLPYLKGVPCPYKGKKWEAFLSPKDIKRALKKIVGEREVEAILDSGDFVLVVLSSGTVKVHKAIFRKLTGYKLKSSNYHFFGDMRRGYRFEGRGSGHGVGMCQWGARYLAIRGYSFQDILQHYYPGTTLIPIYKLLK